MEEHQHEKDEVAMQKTDTQRKIDEIEKKLAEINLDQKEKMKLELQKVWKMGIFVAKYVWSAYMLFRHL